MVIPLNFTLFALGLSPLVARGAPLALHAYAGSSAAANNALIDNMYRAAFQGLRYEILEPQPVPEHRGTPGRIPPGP